MRECFQDHQNLEEDSSEPNLESTLVGPEAGEVDHPFLASLEGLSTSLLGQGNQAGYCGSEATEAQKVEGGAAEAAVAGQAEGNLAVPSAALPKNGGKLEAAWGNLNWLFVSEGTKSANPAGKVGVAGWELKLLEQPV